MLTPPQLESLLRLSLVLAREWNLLQVDAHLRKEEDTSLDVQRRVLLDQRDLPVLKYEVEKYPLELDEDSSTETLQVLARNDWRPAEVLRGIW